MMLPVECIESIITYLPPKPRFHIATDLRLLWIQKRCTRVLEFASVHEASRKGQIDLLDACWQDTTTIHGLVQKNSIIAASYGGHVAVLEWWQTRMTFPFSTYFEGRSARDDAILAAAKCGYVDVLQWWKNQSPFEVTQKMISNAALNGHVSVLNWCRGQLTNSKSMIVWASCGGHTPVLQWWKDNFKNEFDAYMRYCKTRRVHYWQNKNGTRKKSLCSDPGHLIIHTGVDGISFISRHATILDRLNQSNAWSHTGDFSSGDGDLAIDAASEYGHVNVLQWWSTAMPLLHDEYQRLAYSQHCIDWATVNGHIDVLQWWKDYFGPRQPASPVAPLAALQLEYSDWALKDACRYGHVAILQWWKENGSRNMFVQWQDQRNSSNIKRSLVYSHEGIVLACRYGHVPVLNWWKNDSGYKFKYSHDAVVAASRSGQVEILDWWWRHGFSTSMFSKTMVAEASNHVRVLEWWKERVGVGFERMYSTDAVANARNEDAIEWWLYHMEQFFGVATK